MTPEEYKHIEIEKFLESKQGDPSPGFIKLPDGKAVRIADMTSEEYVKTARLISYEDQRKKLIREMNQTDETDGCFR